jgi:hypothetical protein
MCRWSPARMFPHRNVVWRLRSDPRREIEHRRFLRWAMLPTLSQGNRALALRGLGSIEMRRLQQQMLDAHGEAPVTKFVIERHQHVAVGELKNAVGPDSAIAAHRLMETRLGRTRSDDRSEYEPADLYAGLRDCPPVSRSWFSFAGCWCN